MMLRQPATVAPFMYLHVYIKVYFTAVFSDLFDLLVLVIGLFLTARHSVVLVLCHFGVIESDPHFCH
jgi:hypothetical protein